MRVAICHQGFARGDAIGNDIVGMYRLVEKLGMQATVICEWSNRSEPIRTISPSEARQSKFDFMILHHSLFWDFGDELIKDPPCRLVLKYHNITPASFFRLYSEEYANVCAAGLQQTERFVGMTAEHVWLADSEYNRRDLLKMGADCARVFVVPPFNQVSHFLRLPFKADYVSGALRFLFVGRLAPNKGHLHLLRILAAFRENYERTISLTIVGQADPAFESYYHAVRESMEDLGLTDAVEFLINQTDAMVCELYSHSHVYLSCSEHEGFCVPIIEAQAAGLPVVAADTSAVGETAGEEQVMLPMPVEEPDYSLYAALINEICSNRALREHVVGAGVRNVRNRFSAERIENKLVSLMNDFVW